MSWVGRFTCCGSRAGTGRALSPLIGVVIGLSLLGGCQALRGSAEPGSGPADGGQMHLSPVLKRMQSAYADLHAGQFISLADFESPGQVALFRSVRADGQESRRQPALSVLRSRDETGAGSLKFRLDDESRQLRFDGVRSEDRALVRDWTGYTMLMMSIRGSSEEVVLRVGVESGAEQVLRWLRTVRVGPGWNLYRFDVASIGDFVDLADVRAITLEQVDSSGAVDLYLDDVILADNTEWTLGTDAGAGELYVLTRGRRIVVGARGRFELGFANGVIVSWRDSPADRVFGKAAADDVTGLELGNLVDIGGLGPWPIPLAGDWAQRTAQAVSYDDPNLFESWGAAALTTQEVVSATPFRVVIEGQWRFEVPAAPLGRGETESGTETGSAAQRQELAGHCWRYTIYPDGDIYVQVASRAPAGGWAGSAVGYALGLDGRRGFEHVAPRPLDATSDPVDYVLLARTGSRRGDLLWAWPASQRFGHQRGFCSVDGRRLAVVVGAVETGSRVATAHLLRIWPADIDGRVEAESLAGDYQHPAQVTIDAGELVRDAPGDFDGDGFNEAEGCYELRPVGAVLRGLVDPGEWVRFGPIFRVHGSAGQQAWVYAGGRTVKEIGRDADGNALFRLGPLTGGALTLEVHLRPEEDGG